MYVSPADLRLSHLVLGTALVLLAVGIAALLIGCRYYPDFNESWTLPGRPRRGPIPTVPMAVLGVVLFAIGLWKLLS